MGPFMGALSGGSGMSALAPLLGDKRALAGAAKLIYEYTGLDEPRYEARRGRLDVAGERRADVAWKHQRPLRGAMRQHGAAARARLLDVGVFWEIPVRVIDLQQVMEHVADEGGALPALSLIHI